MADGDLIDPVDLGGLAETSGLTGGGLNIPDVGLGNITLPQTMLGDASYTPAPGLGGPDSAGGGGSFLHSLSGLAKDVAPILGIGTSALGAYSGIKGMQYAGQQQNVLKNAQQTQQQAAAPLLSAGQALTPAGTQALLGGPLPPELESIATTWANNKKAQIRQTFASMGIQDSTMIDAALSVVDEEMMQLRANLAQGLLESGQGALGGAAQAVNPAGALAANQGTQAAQAIQNADAALAQMLGRTG
jgi:hypothetical protein